MTLRVVSDFFNLRPVIIANIYVGVQFETPSVLCEVQPLMKTASLFLGQVFLLQVQDLKIRGQLPCLA